VGEVPLGPVPAPGPGGAETSIKNRTWAGCRPPKPSQLCADGSYGRQKERRGERLPLSRPLRSTRSPIQLR